jgi:hypothetical protein
METAETISHGLVVCFPGTLLVDLIQAIEEVLVLIVHSFHAKEVLVFPLQKGHGSIRASNPGSIEV